MVLVRYYLLEGDTAASSGLYTRLCHAFLVFALKYNKQQLLLLLDKITSKILGGHYHGRPPFINIGGHVPPVP